jgi:hypothetical protein
MEMMELKDPVIPALYSIAPVTFKQSMSSLVVPCYLSAGDT